MNKLVNRVHSKIVHCVWISENNQGQIKMTNDKEVLNFEGLEILIISTICRQYFLA